MCRGRVYYSDPDITITDEYVQVGRRTFPIGGIRVVEVEKSTFGALPAENKFHALGNLFWVLCGIFSIFVGENSGALHNAVGVAWHGIGLGASLHESPLYSLRLTGANWSACPLSSEDERYIEQLSFAVGWALYDYHFGNTADLESNADIPGD